MGKYFTYTLIILCHFVVTVNAQVAGTAPRMKQQLTASAYNNYYMQYDDSPYFIKTWSIADVKLVSGEVYKDVRIKYDLYQDHIVYYNSPLKKQLIIDKEIIESISFTAPSDKKKNNLINFCIGDSVKQSKCQLYFVLVTDSISLWSKKYKKINTYTNIASGYSKLGVFYLKEKYYLIIQNQFVNFPSSKRKLFKMFPDEKKVLTQYIRKNKLSFKNEDHLVLIVKELNNK